MISAFLSLSRGLFAPVVELQRSADRLFQQLVGHRFDGVAPLLVRLPFILLMALRVVVLVYGVICTTGAHPVIDL
ncbi:hypothetical protein AW882_14145 [Pseudomonas aeruginosa]|nr:hypothetical protein AW882_14145 [Pseudomonas aeruginosa]